MRKGVQHAHTLGQRREGAGHVIAETDQHEAQEGDDPAGGEVADQLLPGGELRHVLDADQARHQAAGVGDLPEHHAGVHAAAGLHGLLRADLVEIDGVLEVLPHALRGAREQAPAAVDEQDRRTGCLLHLLDRLVDARRVDAKPGDTDCAGRSGQRDPQNGGDMALLVVADAADAGAFQDGVLVPSPPRRSGSGTPRDARNRRAIRRRRARRTDSARPCSRSCMAMSAPSCWTASLSPVYTARRKASCSAAIQALSSIFWMTPLTILRHRVDRSVTMAPVYCALISSSRWSKANASPTHTMTKARMTNRLIRVRSSKVSAPRARRLPSRRGWS